VERSAPFQSRRPSETGLESFFSTAGEPHLSRPRKRFVLPPERSPHADYSGTGNVLNANDPVVRRLILDSLRYRVHEMQVVLWDIETDAVLVKNMGPRPVRPPAGNA
jgi:hypothetical protein